MLSMLTLILAEVLPGLATALSNIDTALSLGPR
jgi:hypothetical protein